MVWVLYYRETGTNDSIYGSEVPKQISVSVKQVFGIGGLSYQKDWCKFFASVFIPQFLVLEDTVQVWIATQMDKSFKLFSPNNPTYVSRKSCAQEWVLP